VLLGFQVGNKEKETSKEAPKTVVHYSQGNLEGSSSFDQSTKSNVA